MEEYYYKISESDLKDKLPEFDTSLRRVSKDGYVMLNSTDMDFIGDDVAFEKLNTNQAKLELATDNWKI